MPATNVKKAEELKPDLILLDIGLPGISGIEAARHMQGFSEIADSISESIRFFAHGNGGHENRRAWVRC
jgi:CheY-like chemotaxis protein